MAGHTSEKRWVRVKVDGVMYDGVSEKASELTRELITKLLEVEEAYQSMQEIYTYSGGTATDLANLLFKENIEARAESGANQEEIDKATDLVNAMTAAHQIYQAADNVAVSQADRLTDLRRMS